VVGAGLPLCAGVCVYMQPLELIKNVCCNLFYYGRHLLFDPATKTPRNPPRKNPIPIWGIYLEMHLYSASSWRKNLNKSNFRRAKANIIAGGRWTMAFAYLQHCN